MNNNNKRSQAIKHQNKSNKGSNKKREYLKTKTSEVVDYFPRDNNDEDFGFNLASMETKNSLFSSKSELLKKKRKQDSQKAKKPAKDAELEEQLDDLDFKTDENNSEKLSSRALLPNFKVGDLVLLCICEIRQTYMIANYTRNKKAMIHVSYSGFDAEKEENFSFKNYFRIGQFVCGAVVSPGNDIQLPQGYMNKKILVSIDPKIVNTGLKKEALSEGMDLWGRFVFDNQKQCYSADFGFTDAEEEIYKFNKNFEQEGEENEDFGEENSEENFNNEEEGELPEEEQELDLNENENENEEEEIENSGNSEGPEEMEFNEAAEGSDTENNFLDISNAKKSKAALAKKKSKNNKLANVSVKIIDLEKDSEHFDPEIIKSKTLNSYYFFKLVKMEKTDSGLTLFVSLNPSKLKFGVKKIEFSQIRPGFLFKANLTRELLNGIEVAFAGNIGTIFADHLKSATKKNKNFLVRVTHVSVGRKNLSLSALTHITNLHSENVIEKYHLIGNVFENVKLDQEVYGGSFLVNLAENTTGFIHKKNIGNLELAGQTNINNSNEETENKDNNAENEKNKKEIKKNKKNKNLNKREESSEASAPAAGAQLPLVLVKEYNYFDDHAILKSVDLSDTAVSAGKSNKDKKSSTTDKSELIKSKYVTWQNLKVGKMLSVKIKEVHSDHLVASVNDFITGKIPKDLLSDYHFTNIPKKFQVGSKLLCRVFKCEYETKNLQFIAKESLMDESIILHESLESLKEGEEIPVIFVGNGLFQHSGSVIGKLQNFSVYEKKEKFKIGKAYRLNVFRVNLNTRKLMLSKEKSVYFPSFGDFDVYMRKHPLLLTVANYLNADAESENENAESNKNTKKNNKNKNKNLSAKKTVSLDEIEEGKIYDFELIPVKKILRLLEKKGIDLNLINEDIELFTQKVLFVKLPETNFYGFLQVELLADFFSEKEFKILYELGNKVSEILKEAEKDNLANNPLEGFEISENKNIIKKLLVVNFDKEAKVLFTSGKQSLMRFSRESLIPKSKEEMYSATTDKLYCGYVNKVNEKGIVIQFLGKFRFLIRTKKAASTEENLSNNESPKELKNADLIDAYLNALEPGQTILVAALFDKVKNKLRFLSGLELFKVNFGVNNSVYNSEKISAEAQNILNDYEHQFKFISGKDKVLTELGDLNAEFNATEYTKGQEVFLEGFVGKLNEEQNEININLKNHSNFKAVLKISNSKFNSENFNAKEVYEKHYTQNNNNAHKFLIYDINYENEIIYLTDIFADSGVHNKDKTPKLIGSTQEFIVDAVFDNYISCHLAADPNAKAMLPCNFHNYNYSKLFHNLNSNKTQNQMDLESLADKDNLLNKVNFTILPGDKLISVVNSYDEDLRKLILAVPEPELLQTINSLIKANSNSNYNNYSNSSSRKNSDFDKITSLIPGKTFRRKINGIKKNFVYVFIDKHTIGRISLKDFNGDQDEIKKLLREGKQSRKGSGNSASEGQTNSELNESLTANLLKMKFKILHVEQLEKNRKIVDLVNMDENNSKNANKETELSSINEKSKMDGETAFKGIISKIDFNSKFPIRVDYANSIEKKLNNKSKSEDTAFHVHYTYLKNFNLNKPNNNNNSNAEVDSENTNIADLFALGEEVKFYLKKQKDGRIIPSLIPFSQLPKKEEVDSKYLVRVLKPIPGRGLIVSIFDNNENNENNNKNKNTGAQESQKTEAFVDISEISDEMHANPLNLYAKGQIALGRIISFDAENSKKFFLSLRQSATNDSLYDILKNGSTIKFKKYFEHYEKSGDYRNKIFKFGASQVLENNQIVLGYVTASSEKGVFIKVGPDTIARAALNELSDEKATNPFLLYKQNQLVICRIIFIDKKENNNATNNNKNSNIKISVSLRESVIKYNLTLKKRDLKQANFYECQVINESNEKYTVSVVGSTFTGVLEKSNEYLKKDAKALKEIRENLENKNTLIFELKELDTSVFPNVIKFSNLNVEDQSTFDRNLVINLLSEQEKANFQINSELYNNVKLIVEKEQENELSDELKELEKETEEVDFEALLDKKDNDEENHDEGENEGDEESEEIMKYDDSEDEQANELVLDHEIKSTFLKGLGITQEQKAQEQNDVEMKDEEEEIEDMEVDEEEDKEEAKTSQHYQSSKQKAKSHLQEELKIREKEVEKKVGEYNSVEDFEKLILSDPQNSLYWIQYSAFILDNLGMDSARKIMDRAVHTVDIANLKDKMNLWIAYMNLENTYGTPERFKEVVQRALEVNNKKEIYKHLVSIYKLSEKYELAFEVFRMCIKEYFEDVQLWKNFIEFLFEVKALRIKNESNVQVLKKLENVFDTKEGLNRCLQTLAKSKHLEIEIFYAQMQYKYGFIEEGRTSFEVILKNHPKRSDIWIVYLDKEIKVVKNAEKIRHIFEKCLTIDFKIKVLKTIIKKYLEYEKEHGNKKTIEHVMALTQKLINNKLSSLQKNEDNEQMEVDDE